jgi:REP element-mobilizing transposase RayT
MPTYEGWDERTRPLAYLITFRTYGTWLHGDERHSVDTHRQLNVRGLPDRPQNKKLEAIMRSKLVHEPTTLNIQQRETVKKAIEEVCVHRQYSLHAVNVRSNHVHSAVSSLDPPEKVAELFKKYATRALRNERLAGSNTKIWSRGCSTRYLWKDRHLGLAIEYVLYGRGMGYFRLNSGAGVSLCWVAHAP